MAPECKLYEKFIFLEADMEQARNNAKNIPGNKLPAVFLKEKKRGGRMAVRMDYEDFLKLHRLALLGLQMDKLGYGGFATP